MSFTSVKRQERIAWDVQKLCGLKKRWLHRRAYLIFPSRHILAFRLPHCGIICWTCRFIVDARAAEFSEFRCVEYIAKWREIHAVWPVSRPQIGCTSRWWNAVVMTALLILTSTKILPPQFMAKTSYGITEILCHKLGWDAKEVLKRASKREKFSNHVGNTIYSSELKN